MQFYINKKKKNISNYSSSLKNNKTMEYNASSKVGKESIDLSLNINSKVDDKDKAKNESGLSIEERIEKLELQISDLTCSSVFQSIDKLHISLVTSPIKKTNVILKNVNFQYAVRLWNYMQEHYEDEIERKKENKDYNEDGPLKKMLDESFLLDYLVLNSIDKDDSEDNKKEVQEKIVDNMIEKVINLDPNISEEELKNVISKQYQVIKYKIVVNEKQIEKIFKKNIDKYLDKINNIEL